MRFVVYGAGAVGGVIGGRLFEAGEDVVLIARGEHHDAIRERGLTVVTDDGDPDAPDGRRVVLPIPVVDHPSRLTITSDDVIVLGMKTQHTRAALDDLRLVAPSDTTVVCAQNGVENERLALRRFARVQAMLVISPTGHLEPGVVEAYASPVSGILDLGRYPTGVDAVTVAVAAALERATFVAQPRADIMTWKYNKLLLNLPTAVQALCGSAEGSAELARRARAEGEAVFDAANIAFVAEDVELERRRVLTSHRAMPRSPKGGSSSQSLARGTGNVESDYLNGEIVLLGRIHGVPTPVNAVLQRHMTIAANERRWPGTTPIDELLAEAGTERPRRA